MEIIIHIPHSSRKISKEQEREFLITKEELEVELLSMTDAYTDELFPESYKRIVFPYSRLVCDVERFREDEEMMAERGMGAIYTRGSCF